MSSNLKIVIGSYGVPWLSHHGASGGVSLASRERACRFAHLAALLKPRLPGYISDKQCGLWPGKPYRVIAVRLEGESELGWLIAECEPA